MACNSSGGKGGGSAKGVATGGGAQSSINPQERTQIINGIFSMKNSNFVPKNETEMLNQITNETGKLYSDEVSKYVAANVSDLRGDGRVLPAIGLVRMQKLEETLVNMRAGIRDLNFQKTKPTSEQKRLEKDLDKRIDIVRQQMSPSQKYWTSRMGVDGQYAFENQLVSEVKKLGLK